MGGTASNRAVARRQEEFAKKTDLHILQLETKLQEIIEKNHAEIKKHIDTVVGPAHTDLIIRMDNAAKEVDERFKKIEAKRSLDSRQIDQQRDLIAKNTSRIDSVLTALRKAPIVKWFVNLTSKG